MIEGLQLLLWAEPSYIAFPFVYAMETIRSSLSHLPSVP